MQGKNSCTLFICLLFGLSVGSLARAQDVFIKPGSTTNNGGNSLQNSGVADMGLKPRAPSTATPSTTTAPITYNPVQVQAPARPAPSSTQTEAIAVPGLSVGPGTFNNAGDSVQIIKLDSEKAAPPTGHGNYSLAMTIKPGSVGMLDRQNANKMLGLTAEEISKNCRLEYDALANYKDGDAEALSFYTQQTGSLRFATSLDTVGFYPTLACQQLKPPVSGIVIAQDNLYKIGLNNVTCTPPLDKRTGTVTLVFRYVGDGKGECLFQ